MRKWRPILKRWKPILEQLEGAEAEEYESEDMEDNREETTVHVIEKPTEPVLEHKTTDNIAPAKCGPSGPNSPSKSVSPGSGHGEDNSTSNDQKEDKDNLSENEDCLVVVEQPMKSAQRQQDGKLTKKVHLESLGAGKTAETGIQPMKT